MRKGLSILLASAVVCSVAFASPSANEPSFTGLNATEQTVLFGEGSTTQVVALDDAEMKATEGEFGFSFKFFENYTIEVFKGTTSKWHTNIIPFYSNTGAYSTQNQQGY